MNLQQALEHANAFALPGFMIDDESLSEERRKNEEAIQLLIDAWKKAPLGEEGFDFDIIMTLADNNRQTCDTFGIERLERTNGKNLARKLDDQDTILGLAAAQKRKPQQVADAAGPALTELSFAMMEKPWQGTIMGIDLETTAKDPDRGYIINLGFEFMDLSSKARPHDGHAAYFGLPELYKEKGVPLTHVHKITWPDIAGKEPFRQAKRMQEALLEAMCSFPIMAHNAAFEDSWLMLHLNGYAEAKKQGKIKIIDSREICRKLDPATNTLPHEARPAALENWAKRRGTLAPDEEERHLGLDDVDLMFKTAVAELKERNLLAS